MKMACINLIFDVLNRVCKKFDETGGKYLSRSFIQLEKRHGNVYKRMKAMLPRRHSERRSHPLSRHCEILYAVETRFSMLNMTFMKFIEGGACCFIPGKVLDEVCSILQLIESAEVPPKTHLLLQELRDISSMAMEHFDEHIAPTVKQRMIEAKAFNLIQFIKPSKSSNKALNPIPTNANPESPDNSLNTLQFPQLSTIHDQMRRYHRNTKVQRDQITQIFAHIQKLTRRFKKQAVRLRTQQTTLEAQKITLDTQQVTLDSQQRQLESQKRQLETQKRQIDSLECKQSDEKRLREEYGEKLSKSTEMMDRMQKELGITTFEPFDGNKEDLLGLRGGNIKPREARVVDLGKLGIGGPKSDFQRFLDGDLHRRRELGEDGRKRKRGEVEYEEVPMIVKQSRASIHCDYYLDNLRETLSSIIKENITDNISPLITGDHNNSDDNKRDHSRGITGRNRYYSTFLGASLESLLAPITGIKSRKRKSAEDLDFK